jgi:xylan 1,4-beta-xylosidase
MTDTRDKKDIILGLPITVHLNKVKNIPANIQRNNEFLFVLKGILHVVINNKHYKLVENDVVFINSGDVYQMDGEKDNLVLSMQIEYDFFYQALKREQSLYLCNSTLNEKSIYDSVRRIMAKIMFEYSNRENGYELQIMSLLYKLIYLLHKDFLLTEQQDIQFPYIQRSKYNDRVNNILKYVKQNYFQPISLQDVADSQYLTPEYLSKFFKNQMGMTFTRYLNEFRLSQAVKELMRTDNSVIKVAMNNGFPNLAAFNKIFKEVYNTTPAEYRSEIRKKQSANSEKHIENSEITKVEYSEAFQQLTKYVAYDEASVTESSTYEMLNHVNIDVAVNESEEKAVLHSWRNMINLGYASDGLRSDLQQHLTDIQNTVKFRYARFQGVFSDEMLTYGDEKEDKTTYNFTKIDKLIDFIYSIGLKPFIELGDKAKVLNLVSDKIMYFRPSTHNERSFNESRDLLEKFIIHCVNRYGIYEVSQWYFEIWKKGDKDYVFWDGDFDEYIDVFQSYLKIIKQVVPGAKVGGPGLNPEMNMKWLIKLLKLLQKRGIRPDFFSLTLYPYDLIEDSIVNKLDVVSDRERKDSNRELINYKKRLLPSRDENFIKMNLDKVLAILDSSGIDFPEIHVTEWNCSVSHRHPAHDTTFKGAYIVKNIIDNLDGACSFGYWLCSDISGELKDSKNLLYGDMGLISANGIKKPGFYAYEMLSKLGNRLIDKGEGYIITSKSPFSYEIITYNYKHFGYLYCLNEETEVSLDQYYDIFENQKDLHLSINLKGINRGRYRIKKYTLNRKHGSIFDEWLDMNAVYNIRKNEIDYLKQICVPKQSISYMENADELIIESHLEPHEVNLYEITFEYNLKY